MRKDMGPHLGPSGLAFQRALRALGSAFGAG